jgi:hypothetical protein
VASTIFTRASQGFAATALTLAFAFATPVTARAAPVTPEDLHACVDNGGDEVLCCARYGGDYTTTPPSPAPPKGGVHILGGSMCVFPGGARIAFREEGGPVDPPPTKPGVDISQLPAPPRA